MGQRALPRSLLAPGENLPASIGGMNGTNVLLPHNVPNGVVSKYALLRLVFCDRSAVSMWIRARLARAKFTLLPEAAPQVGHWTASTCFRLISFFVRRNTAVNPCTCVVSRTRVFRETKAQAVGSTLS